MPLYKYWLEVEQIPEPGEKHYRSLDNPVPLGTRTCKDDAEAIDIAEGMEYSMEE